MTRILAYILMLAPGGALAATPQDTTHYLDEVTVRAYFAEQPLLRLTTSAGVIGEPVLAHQSGASLLPALNTVPGVRMEERSPGSYRLSLRGSLLRSPFGVRNVKVYLDEIPLTDAGGNTYFNILDAGSLSSIEILKGPDGSLFGANSGGVVLLRPHGGPSGDTSPSATLRLSGGAYGLFHQQLGVSAQPANNYGFSINQAYQRADGYRQHSAMDRKSIQTVQRWRYHANNELRLIGMYSDLYYDTPGGLTAAQFAEDPRLARPSTGAAPGAADQRASIRNQTVVGGLVHDAQISPKFRHVASVFGMHTDFRNPFITNYELRDEGNLGFRTYIDYTAGDTNTVRWRINAGMEWQLGNNHIANYDNNGGVRGDRQAIDALRSRQYFYFARVRADIWSRLVLEASASLNYYGYAFKSSFPVADPKYTANRFDAEWMPRVALSYLFTPTLAWRASVSRGYSPPTIAEVRPSDKIINTALAAETGWNYETGARWQSPDRRFRADGSLFYYRMDDAIIRQLRDSGAEYFGNAGTVEQRGAELSVAAWLVEPRPNGWLHGIQLGSNLTLSKFRFGDYRVGDNDFTGNKLTGVPGSTVVSDLLVRLPFDIDAYLMHNYTASIPLNDANTVFADEYHLLQAKVSWEKSVGNRLTVQFFVGGDNLLSQQYSLGNDINAFGGRFFNAAAPRNFYGGLTIRY
ncbi:TonB-dependent receptor [Parapedobacter sp. 10938]|uniref:TonB-dependent receptor n=1 Tax=Parapedobacter flavus TaxID=3110225 RepID=UPI002DBA6E53|nr:TonB-dependent receptor [Parapedobacter sp. 10938]MEC3879706.1 TonB-dependent receptor [Parapedobacter sp. 10938]